MKKVLLSAVSAALIATSSFALDTTGIHTSVGLAYQSVTDADSGMALVVNVGKDFNNLQLGQGKLGIEGEVTRSIVKPSIYNIDLTITTFAVYATYKYNFSSNLYLKPRLGILHESVSVDNSSYDGTDTGLSYGIALGYDINNNISAYIDWTKIESDVSNLTIGASYSF